MGALLPALECSSFSRQRHLLHGVALHVLFPLSCTQKLHAALVLLLLLLLLVVVVVERACNELSAVCCLHHDSSARPPRYLGSLHGATCKHDIHSRTIRQIQGECSLTRLTQDYIGNRKFEVRSHHQRQLVQQANDRLNAKSISNIQCLRTAP